MSSPKPASATSATTSMTGTARRRRHPRARPARREPHWQGLALAGPAMGVYTVFVLAPFCYALYLSFFNWGGVGPMTFAGFSNYTALWEQPGISVSFLHAAILIAFFAALPILIALLLTALMSREPIRGLTFYRTVLFLPQVVALVAIAVVWDWILAPAGPVNTVLRDIGLGFLAQDWLGSFTWALPAVGIIGSWVGYGFAMVVFMAGVEKIPQSLYDAARVDGAGAVREFFAVTLPSLRNELTVVLVLTVTGSFTTFDIVYILTSGGPGTSTVVPAYSVFDLAFTDYRVGAAAAAGVVLALIVFVLAVVIMHLNRTAEESSRA